MQYLKPTGTLTTNPKEDFMGDVTCPLCGVSYQVDDPAAEERLKKVLEEREQEYTKERYEEAKEKMNALLKTQGEQ